MTQKTTGPPGRPILPPEAEDEILNTLFTNMRISSGEIAAILKKHNVSGDTELLQDRYRKQLGQRLMASIGTSRAAERFWPAAASTSCWSAATTGRPSRPFAAASRAR